MVRQGQSPQDTGIGRGKAGSQIFDVRSRTSTGTVTSQKIKTRQPRQPAGFQ